MTELLTQKKLCSYCEYILKCIGKSNTEEDYKQLNNNELYKIVDKYSNSPCLPLIEEALSSIKGMDISNISKLIAEYGVTNQYTSDNNFTITHYYWGEIIKESSSFKSQTIYDSTHTYIIKYKEWVKVSGNQKRLQESYIADKDKIIAHKKWDNYTDRVKEVKKVFTNLNFKRWNNLTVEVSLSFHYLNNEVRRFLYFADDKYIHDAEFSSDNKLVGITHLPKYINSKEYTILDEYTEQDNSTINLTTNSVGSILMYSACIISGIAIGIKYFNSLNKIKLN